MKKDFDKVQAVAEIWKWCAAGALPVTKQLKELQQRKRSSRHLWHVMEELKACERRVVTMQETEGQMQETKKS